MTRLKTTELKAYRERMLKVCNECRICGHSISSEDAVLDHDHETGHIRSVLHRQCNQVEGRVLGWCKRIGKEVSPSVTLLGILDHWNKDYSDMPFHPSHLTNNEKEIKRLRSRMRKVKRKSTKAKYAKMIKDLQ